MKILHIITSFALGGAERVATDLAIEQTSLGHQVKIVALRATPTKQEDFASDLLDNLHKCKVETHALNARDFRLSIPYLLFRVRKIIKDYDPDIVNLHADPSEFIVSLISRTIDITIIRTIHNTVIWPTHPIIGWITENAFKHDYIIAVSKDTLTSYNNIRRRYRLRPSGNCFVINNGVSIPKKILKEKNNQSELNIGFYGRNTYQKGLDVFLESLHILSSNKDLRLTVDVYTDFGELKIQLIHNSSISIRIHSPTFKSRILIAHNDLIVVPSRFEGLGLVALEAMAVGTPLILTEVLGLREIIPNDWPLTIRPEDPHDLAKKIEDVYFGQYNLENLSSILKEHVKKYSIEKQVNDYMTVYKIALDQKNNSHRSN